MCILPLLDNVKKRIEREYDIEREGLQKRLNVERKEKMERKNGLRENKIRLYLLQKPLSYLSMQYCTKLMLDQERGERGQFWKRS